MRTLKKYKSSKSHIKMGIDYDYSLDEAAEIERGNTLWLIMALVEHTDELRQEIIELRKEVNSYEKKLRKAQGMDASKYQERYIDLISDIYMDFTDFAAYKLYKDAFGDMKH